MPRSVTIFAAVLSCALLLNAQQTIPFTIAHRGASADAPENTVVAFREASRQQADAIEIDVRMTKDSMLVVIHDATVDRTTDGSGEVAEMTFAEIRTLDAGGWFGKKFSGERIPSLFEAASAIDTGKLFIVEIKSKESGIEWKVIQELRRAGIASRTLLKSFDPDVIRTFARLAPDIRRIYVFAFHIPWFNFTFGTSPRFEHLFEIPAHYLQTHLLAAGRTFIAKARSSGYGVIVWDVQHEEQMMDMIDAGVEGIETDFPGVLKKIRDRRLQPAD